MTSDERCELCIKVAVNGPVRFVGVRTSALNMRRGAARWPREVRVACSASTLAEKRLPKLTTLDADTDRDAAGDGALDGGSFSRQFFLAPAAVRIVLTSMGSSGIRLRAIAHKSGPGLAETTHGAAVNVEK